MMRTLVCTIALWGAICSPAQSQLFKHDTLDLSIIVEQAIAVELTQDDRLDYWLYGTDTQGRLGYWIYENQGNNTYTLQALPIAPLQQATFAFADFNRDNQLDVVVSGRTTDDAPVTQVYYSQDGSLAASPTVLNAVQAHSLVCADFDLDGKIDIFLNGLTEAGTAVAQCYRNTDQGFLLNAVAISPTVSGTALAYDWNNDEYVDILQTGVLPDGDTITQLYQNNGQFVFQDTAVGLPLIAATTLSVGDVNQDGRVDILLSGYHRQQPITRLYQNEGSTYTLVDLALPPLAATFATLADYNHDGLTDVGLAGEDVNDQPLARWYLNADTGWDEITYDSLASPGGKWAVGDMDNDGHLDLLRGATAQTPALLLVNQSAGENNAPSAPLNPSISAIDTATVFRWAPGTDDRTDPRSFTYEMYVIAENAQQFSVSPEYQDTTKARVDHGRLGFNTTHTVNGLPEGTYYWSVAAVDNAFQLGTSCEGEDGRPLCFTIDREDTTVCAGTILQLSAPGTVSWESVRGGALGTSNQLTYEVQENDVLYFTTEDSPCRLAYSLKVNALPAPDSLLTADTTVCAGETLTLTIDTAYSSATWFSALQGALATGSELVFEAQETDTLWVEIPVGQCVMRDTLVVTVPSGENLLAADTVRITAGASVTLSATGAEQYRWSPAAGLSDITLANPTASPTATTTYVVLATTAQGCLLSDTVRVLVENSPATTTLFVPNLFSPNGDGQNDTFRLYGDNIQSVTWQVYDRQGTRLFEANRLEAGWDGQYRGHAMPTGVYLWKVSGKDASGAPLQFDGQQSGMLRLVR